MSKTLTAEQLLDSSHFVSSDFVETDSNTVGANMNEIFAFAEAYYKAKVEATNPPEENDNVEYKTEEAENESIMWNLAYRKGWNDCKEQLLEQ